MNNTKFKKGDKVAVTVPVRDIAYDAVGVVAEVYPAFRSNNYSEEYGVAFDANTPAEAFRYFTKDELKLSSQ